MKSKKIKHNNKVIRYKIVTLWILNLILYYLIAYLNSFYLDKYKHNLKSIFRNEMNRKFIIYFLLNVGYIVYKFYMLHSIDQDVYHQKKIATDIRNGFEYHFLILYKNFQNYLYHFLCKTNFCIAEKSMFILLQYLMQ